uniref:Uncharacterized protein n=1 Tax=Rhizophora mucronata TaxID=61149 RepID=A0A2P2PM40_RHIMU
MCLIWTASQRTITLRNPIIYLKPK